MQNISSNKFLFFVIATQVEIEGAPDLYVKSGSELKLKCLITHHSSHPPIHIFWYHNQTVINYNSPRGDITVESNENITTVSEMNINKVCDEDSGNYSCKPFYADPASIMVHVLNGELDYESVIMSISNGHHHLILNSFDIMLRVFLLTMHQMARILPFSFRRELSVTSSWVSAAFAFTPSIIFLASKLNQ